MFVQKNQSGLVVVTNKLPPKELPKNREYGDIELKDMELREELSRILAKIAGMGGGLIQEKDRAVNQIRRYVTEQFAHQLLGRDWGYEVKC